MKNLFTLLFTLATVFALQAQHTVSGTITDSKGKAIEFATVTIIKAADSTLVKGAVTELDGRFEFPGIAAGDYLATASSVGYAVLYSPKFTISGSDVNLGALSLKESSTELGEVTIAAKKPMIEVKADKTVFNVEDNINSTGSTAMELLQKSPGVVVDKDDNITMKGKNGVMVYIDGRPTNLDQSELAALLRNMPSDNISAIEIISNPSAKYDAAGTGGIINIRLKKNKNIGMNGNASAGVYFGITPKTSESVSLNYRNTKYNVYGNYSFNAGRNENDQNFYRIQNGTIFDAKAVNGDETKDHNYKAGVDFFLNDKSTLGFMANGGYSGGFWDASTRTAIRNQAADTMTSFLVATNKVNTTRFRLNGNMNYRYADTLGHELNVDLDYGRYASTSLSYQPNFYKDPTEQTVLYESTYRNSTPTDIDIYTGKVDWEQNLWKGKFSAGAKVSYVKTYNVLDFWNVINQVDVFDPNRSNKFTYTENVNALYANYNRSFGKKWSIQAGLRVEQTRSKGELVSAQNTGQDTIERSYINPFPSAALTYKLSEMNQFNLTYSRRIDRPSYQDLNPFEFKLDELTYNKGNPFLQPQYTNSIELTHTFMYFLNTTIGYSRTNDYFTDVTDTTEVTRSFLTKRNLALQQVYSINISSPIPIGKVAEGFVNLNFNRGIYDADFGNGKVVKLKANNFNFYGQLTTHLPKKFNFEISGWWSSPGVWGIFKSGAMGGFDLGLEKKLLDDRMSIKLALTDVMRTQRWSGETAFGGLYMRANGGWESRQLRLNISYRFGSDQIKGARERKSGAESESGRIKAK